LERIFNASFLGSGKKKVLSDGTPVKRRQRSPVVKSAKGGSFGLPVYPASLHLSRDGKSKVGGIQVGGGEGVVGPINLFNSCSLTRKSGKRTY